MASSFLARFFKSVQYALNGMWLLIISEVNFRIQLCVALFITTLGAFVGLSTLEWILQFLVIGMVLVAEAVNSAIEKLADFVHGEQHKKIGEIKDIAAAAPAIAALVALIIAGLIYLPKIS